MKPHILMQRTLEPLQEYLNKKGLVELIINKPGEIILEFRDGFKYIQDKSLTIEYLEGFAQQLATSVNQKFGEYHPILSCTLPIYHYRTHIVGKSAVDSGFCMAIRVASADKYPLSTYFNEEEIKIFENAIATKKNILIAGGTSSGKTTFLNSVLPLINDEERILTIEDAKELSLTQPNTVRLLKSKMGTDVAKTTYADLINSAVRLRPDRIILGELDIENTFPFLRVLNTGHGGSMATLHADSVDKSIEALIMNIILAGAGGNETMLEKYITSSIDIVVHLKRIDRRTYKATLKELK
ncbi:MULTISPECIES: ATPase, T2SS/T4P/T4SS family [Arcobacteraceae]|uniref:ATPase, T2SS/T4P/T4SS family n=1 Tax=Arcobacteraceae TaxID=2808963 RepID=UPI00081E4395|nr:MULTISPECIES: ATPase, T2SS/T4P/T4SS family [Arcobacteraceae]OCL81910.1 Type IV secretion system protein VirB11 [Arcobacter porcinus]OCL90589.1 Type IV secretion system protein VirB11 [Aliarcobacter thereius]